MSASQKSLNFIEQIIEEDLKNGFPKDQLQFRFPPEPNGYLHIGTRLFYLLKFRPGFTIQRSCKFTF